MTSGNDSILNSLKGRIWLAVSALAILNCFCGLGAYLAVSFFITEPFITIFVTFFVLAFTTMIFGWWLANEVTRPIESVILLAKSLERSPSASLPRTTGASETDELLRTLHRNSRQLQNLISMMDDVAAGKTEAATMPIENSDRLSASFQKLVSRVTDSISAKRELDALQDALARMKADLSGLRGGKLDLDIRSDHFLTKEIADFVRFLANRLSQLARSVQVSSIGAVSAASEARRSLQQVIEARDDRASKLSREFAGVGELSGRLDRLVNELSSALTSVESTVSASNENSEEGGDLSAKVAALASRSAEGAKKVQKLRSRVNSIAQTGRIAHEIARKSNLIALNTSIKGIGDGSADSTSVLVGEVGSISERAEALSAEVRSLGEALSAEVAELSNLFGSITSESADAARDATRDQEIALELRRHISRVSAVQPSLRSYCTDQASETERIVTAVDTLSQDRGEDELVRESEQQLQRISSLIETLRESVSDLGPAPVISEAKFAAPKPVSEGFPFERTASNEPLEMPAES